MLEMYFHLRETRDLGLLDIFRRHPNADLRTEVARNPNATSEMLLELASDADEMVRQAVSSNPGCSRECIDLLLVDPVDRVTLHLSTNPNLPPEIMREWAGRGGTVDVSLARNPHCPEDVMLKLIEFGDYEVCMNLACNPHASGRILEVLAASEEESVRGQTAFNDRLPLRALVRLLRDDDPGVRCAALTNWQCPASFLVEASKSKSFDVLISVARHPRTPPKILATLADYEYLAEEYDPEWDPDVGDPDTSFKQVLVALASNPMVPKDALSRLAAHEDEDVAGAAKKNPRQTFDDEDDLWKTISVHWDPNQGKPFIRQPY